MLLLCLKHVRIKILDNNSMKIQSEEILRSMTYTKVLYTLC